MSPFRAKLTFQSASKVKPQTLHILTSSHTQYPSLEPFVLFLRFLLDFFFFFLLLWGQYFHLCQYNPLSWASFPTENQELSCNFFFQEYLFGCSRSQLQNVGSLVEARGIQFPDQGLNLGPLHWEHRILATEPPGKSLSCNLKFPSDSSPQPIKALLTSQKCNIPIPTLKRKGGEKKKKSTHLYLNINF